MACIKYVKTSVQRFYFLNLLGVKRFTRTQAVYNVEQKLEKLEILGCLIAEEIPAQKHNQIHKTWRGKDEIEEAELLKVFICAHCRVLQFRI